MRGMGSVDASAVEREKLMDRVRALLAMTTSNGCTEAEATTAAAKAAKLMEEHDLKLTDVNSLKDERSTVSPGMRSRRSVRRTRAAPHSTAYWPYARRWWQKSTVGSRLVWRDPDCSGAWSTWLGFNQS